MPIITISRGAFSKGRIIAEKLAERLGYECISRDILLEASEQFNIPEIKLERALNNAPSILERFTHGKEKYITYIRKAFLEHVEKDNVVYHGLAGQFFLKGISHVIKTRIISNIKDRVDEEIKREGVSERKARYLLKKDEDERRKWGMHLYGIDACDTSLYDIVLHIDTLSVEDVVDILSDISTHSCFQATQESRSKFNDLLFSARIEAALVEEFPNVKVTSKDGELYFEFPPEYKNEDKALIQIKKLIKEI